MRSAGGGEGDVPPLAELTAEEQTARVREARDGLLQTEVYGRCKEAAWRAVDAALDAESEEVLLKAPRPLGKVETAIDIAGHGASQLLSRWPLHTELRWEHAALAWLVNAHLPPSLRRALWRVKLRAPAARTRFEAKAAESPLALISPRDAVILRQCQTALQQGDPTLLSSLPRMRACASYRDSLDSIGRSLEERAEEDEERLMAAALAPDAAGAPSTPPPPRAVFWLLPLLRVFGEEADPGAISAPVRTLPSASHQPCFPSSR